MVAQDQAADESPRYTIGKVVELTGLSARQLRYYEDRGLVYPARSEGNQRLYTDQQVERLKRIRQYLDQGLNTAGIRSLLGGDPTQEAPVADEEALPSQSPAGSRQDDEEPPTEPFIDDYPARHLLRRDASRSIYPLSHPEELLKRKKDERGQN